MSGMGSAIVDRLRVTFDLHEFGVNLRAQRFRRDHPTASEREIAGMVAAWLAARPYDIDDQRFRERA